jgi:hypothetical protein
VGQPFGVFFFVAHLGKSFSACPTAGWLASRINASLARMLVSRNALRAKLCMRMPIHVMAPNERLGKLPAEALSNLLKLAGLTTGSSDGI